jgi:hypothetical protein
VSYTGVTVDISFDINSGVFVFDTDDTDHFPAGVYTFEITITVGSVSQTTQFTMTIVAHCDFTTLTVVHQPQLVYYYHMGSDPMIIFSYDLTTIVTSTVSVNCGSPFLVWQTDIGFSLDIIFSYDTCIDSVCDLIVYCDIDCAGEYSIQFNFYYNGMPSVNVQSNVFVVIVVNICIPPPGCINIIGCGIPDPVVNPPSIDIQIEVTVSVDVTIELPPWNCGTPGCDTVIIPICINCDVVLGGDVVVIVNNEINIHIDSCDCNGCCDGGSDGSTIIIIINGCLGVVCAPVEIPVVVIFPCFDVSLYYIQPMPIPDFSCVLLENCVWTHDSFIIVSQSTEISNLCGGMSYSIDVDISIGIYISYDIDLHIMTLYCDDMGLVDMSFTYTIVVVLTDYSDCSICVGCCGSISGTITIVNPCLNPTIEIGIVINIDFDFNGSVVWNPPPCTVDPPICFP